MMAMAQLSSEVGGSFYGSDSSSSNSNFLEPVGTKSLHMDWVLSKCRAKRGLGDREQAALRKKKRGLLDLDRASHIHCLKKPLKSGL